ncbi:unnamed protein product [Phyllotreta striolata]|uniref:Uncharacterized protein n=1 Tax=Phyllotreta striolata TaxID=444603 RepID=A0A9N9TZK6_PHYSR|nr:unnamed protein product [Phyllotreta striolata]
MKFQLVLVLSLAALACAVPTTPSPVNGPEKRVTIDEDGTITVLSGSGKKIVISKAIGHPGPKDIEISVDGPFGPVKRIQVDGATSERTVDLFDVPAKHTEEDREKRSSKESKDKKNKKPQTEVLSQIFKEFEGVVDEASYENLLGKINSAVQAGELNPAVYEVLQSLNHYKYAERYGNVVPFMVRGYPYGNQYATPQQQGQYQGVGVPRLPFVQQYFGAREQFQQGKESQYPQQYYQKSQQYYQKPQQYYQQPEQYYQQSQQYYPQPQQYYQQPQQYYQQSQQYYQQPEQTAFSPRWTQWRSLVEPSVNPMHYF